MILILACSPADKTTNFKDNITIAKINNPELEIRIYLSKKEINISELVSHWEYPSTNLAVNDPFLYLDEKQNIRVATHQKQKWVSWKIMDKVANYYGNVKEINFDSIELPELFIESRYEEYLSSTGEMYEGNIELWNQQNFVKYFDFHNYNYENDMGRNGDNTFVNECQYAGYGNAKKFSIEFLKSQGNCMLDSSILGTYTLKDSILVKVF